MRYEADGSYSWLPINDFKRKINCSCVEGTLAKGTYLIFFEIEQDSAQSSVIALYSWFVIRSDKPVERFSILANPEPHFLSKMIKACCLEKGQALVYDAYPGVKRYFSLSESGTSFGGYFYINS